MIGAGLQKRFLTEEC
jgi:hypothetical protein